MPLYYVLHMIGCQLLIKMAKYCFRLPVSTQVFIVIYKDVYIIVNICDFIIISFSDINLFKCNIRLCNSIVV